MSCDGGVHDRQCGILAIRGLYTGVRGASESHRRDFHDEDQTPGHGDGDDGAGRVARGTRGAAHEHAGGSTDHFCLRAWGRKSVIAAAYFNKVAAERGLPDRAIYRGANPQAELSAVALEGLRKDGVALPTARPSAITDDDVSAATHIFAIGCTLPQHAASSGKAENWSDVPELGDGYAATRDAIKRHVEHLLDQLQKR